MTNFRFIFHKKNYNPLLLLCPLCPTQPNFLHTQSLTKYYTYVSWFIQLLEPMKIHNFLHRWC
jgi:hypothetical protein